jgi:hypothetical protein
VHRSEHLDRSCHLQSLNAPVSALPPRAGAGGRAETLASAPCQDTSSHSNHTGWFASYHSRTRRIWGGSLILDGILRLLAGLYTPEEGSISVGGMSLQVAAAKPSTCRSS